MAKGKSIIEKRERLAKLCIDVAALAQEINDWAQAQEIDDWAQWLPSRIVQPNIHLQRAAREYVAAHLNLNLSPKQEG